MHDMKHMWLMALACGIPLLIILVLPLMGIQANYTVIAVVLMVVLHVAFMGYGMHSTRGEEHGKH